MNIEKLIRILVPVVGFSVFSCQKENQYASSIKANPTAHQEEVFKSVHIGSDQHGSAYSDKDSFKENQELMQNYKVHKIEVRSGERIDGIGLVLKSIRTGKEKKLDFHGGGGGSSETFTLGAGEYLLAIKASVGKKSSGAGIFNFGRGKTRIVGIGFVTNQRKIRIEDGKVTIGSNTDNSYWIKGKDEKIDGTKWHIVGLHGRSGKELDGVGAFYTKRPKWHRHIHELCISAAKVNESDHSDEDKAILKGFPCARHSN